MTDYLVVAALAGFLVFCVEEERLNSHEKTHKLEIASIRAEQSDAEIQHRKRIIDAQNGARIRERALRTDADSVRSELDRLRDAAAAVSPAGEQNGNHVDPAAPLRVVLAACAKELVDLAGIADRHANDLQTLIEASQ